MKLWRSVTADDIIISLGFDSGEYSLNLSPIPAEIIPPNLLVLDLIYNRTRFLQDAEAAGCMVMDGETMLLHQGAAAFTLWTGQPAPLDAGQ